MYCKKRCDICFLIVAIDKIDISRFCIKLFSEGCEILKAKKNVPISRDIFFKLIQKLTFHVRFNWRTRTN